MEKVLKKGFSLLGIYIIFLIISNNPYIANIHNIAFTTYSIFMPPVALYEIYNKIVTLIFFTLYKKYFQSKNKKPRKTSKAVLFLGFLWCT